MNFAGQAFAWGRADCVVMVHDHLARAGHALPDLPRYRTRKGAIAAVKAQGVETLPALLDVYLKRIAPAFALPGDVIGVLPPDEGDPLAALIIKSGELCFGWEEDTPMLCNMNLPATASLLAWRIRL